MKTDVDSFGMKKSAVKEKEETEGTECKTSR